MEIKPLISPESIAAAEDNSPEFQAALDNVLIDIAVGGLIANMTIKNLLPEIFDPTKKTRDEIVKNAIGG